MSSTLLGRMNVVKRDGTTEPVSFDKILARMRQSCEAGGGGAGSVALHDVDPTEVVKQVISVLKDGIHTSELDDEAARLCALHADQHPDYLDLAARIVHSNHDKNTRRFGACFVSRMTTLAEYGVVDPTWVTQRLLPARDQLSQLEKEAPVFMVDYFGFKTLERSYLLRLPEKAAAAFAGGAPVSPVVERPMDMMLRVATFLYDPCTELDQVRDCFERLCSKEFTHASPTLFNSGTKHPQLLSCFLGGIHDSLDGIYDALHRCAKISKFAGGIGLHLHDVRGRGAHITGTNGQADGLVPLLRVFNETARYVNQGGKRNGSMAVFLEPHHPDILAFLEMKRNTGLESERARNLFYGVWLSDLFMKRVQNDEAWSLFDPSETHYQLSDLFGVEYEQAYLALEAAGKAKETVPARTIWKALLTSQLETGVPYVGFKDHVNRKSNHQHLGVVRSSNLCMEIVEYSDDKEWACCTLASLALPTFAHRDKQRGTISFDFARFEGAVRRVVRNLNRIVDLNQYPIEETRRSNLRHRPLGIGVQGLADLFAKWRLPFDSAEARQWNKVIFEHLYFYALSESLELAKRDGPYESFAGSPFSLGFLQQDLWNVPQHSVDLEAESSSTVPPLVSTPSLNWGLLRSQIRMYGTRNSMLTALMPTATTSQILGFNECFEPYTSQLYVRRTMAGEFVMVNRYLVEHLMEIGKWTSSTRQALVSNRGSIQQLADVPEEIRQLYKTVWEIRQSTLIEMSAERGPFIDQSQSLNLFMAGPTLSKLSTLHVHAWKLGLKTGMYYLRNQPASHMQQFGVASAAAPPKEAQRLAADDADEVCRRVPGPDGKWTVDPTCESCSA